MLITFMTSFIHMLFGAMLFDIGGNIFLIYQGNRVKMKEFYTFYYHLLFFATVAWDITLYIHS